MTDLPTQMNNIIVFLMNKLDITEFEIPEEVVMSLDSTPLFATREPLNPNIRVKIDKKVTNNE